MPAKLNIDIVYVIKRASEGASANQISKELNCSHPTIGRLFKENNLKMKFIKSNSISGYSVKEYAKKYNFNTRSIQRWIVEGKLSHIIENGFRVIPFEDGDSFAKSKQVDICKLIRMNDSKQYNKTKLAQIFNISRTKLDRLLRDNIRNFGLSGDSPMEINYNLDI